MNTDTWNEYFVNSKITEDIMTTKGLDHDLDRYLNEILVETPSEKEKEMILQKIITYYDSLNAVFVKFTREHPCNSK